MMNGEATGNINFGNTKIFMHGLFHLIALCNFERAKMSGAMSLGLSP
jgi:hypothetical protein